MKQKEFTSGFSLLSTCIALGLLLASVNTGRPQTPANEPPPVEPPPVESPNPTQSAETKTVTTTTTTSTVTTESQNEASVDQATPGSFHDQLAPYGEWVQTEHGLVWHPAVPQSWRPYYDGGHWVYTDAGWYWQSDYPWGDIAFHYGRWSYHAGLGWAWTPGYEYAPAWVYWRHSDGYIGWAPLPADTVLVGGVWHYHGAAVAVDYDFGLTPSFFTFVEYGHFSEHDYRHFIVPQERVTVIYRSSVIVNNYRVDGHGRFVNEGLGRERMEALTHHELKVVPVHELHMQEHRDHLVQRQDDIKIVKAGGKIQADKKMEPRREATSLNEPKTEARTTDEPRIKHETTDLSGHKSPQQTAKSAQPQNTKNKKKKQPQSNNQ